MKLLIDSSTNYLYLCLIDNGVNKRKNHELPKIH